MFKRNLVLGGLIAGAFLLPNLAVAGGSVQGACVNCHTMHNSQNGVRMTGLTNGIAAKDALLAGSGCVGCHANGDENTSSGVPNTAGAKAPQVDLGAGSGYVLNGGYFTAGGTSVESRQHNVRGLQTIDTKLGKQAPGGSLQADLLTCQACHTSAGHHANAAGKYRMLTGVNNTATTGTKYGPAALATATVGARGNNVYEATNMNDFCATCHSTFHTTQAGSTANTWVRHPTDIQVTASTTNGSVVTRTTANDIDKVVVGVTTQALGTTRAISTAGSNGTIMCISCHVPHGGPYADLLSFNYSVTENLAGGSTASDGCETCHSYSNAGM